LYQNGHRKRSLTSERKKNFLKKKGITTKQGITPITERRRTEKPRPARGPKKATAKARKDKNTTRTNEKAYGKIVLAQKKRKKEIHLAQNC
jgi:hypothetical protein